MSSSLATQLAAIRAANVSVLDRKKRQKSHGVSLIFDSKVAVTQDYETIYGISLQGFRELEEIDPRFEIFSNSLFAVSSIGVDRLVQTKQQNIALDNAIGHFLELLAPRILLQPAIKALEWLVRRFRIHEHNAELLLVNILPYYAHPIFIRILDIIPLPLVPLFSFLTNSKQQLHNPSRNLMVRALATDGELFSLVSQHISHQIVNKRDYHTLCAFWSSMTVSAIIYMKDQGKLGDEIIADRVLPYIPDAISQRKSCEAQISGYMIVTVLAFQCKLSTCILDATISSIASNWTKSSVKCGLTAIAQLINEYSTSDWNNILPKPIYESIERLRAVNDEFLNSCLRLNVSRFLSSWALSVISFSPNKLNSILCLFSPSFSGLLSESDDVNILSTIIVQLGKQNHLRTEIADFFSRLSSIGQDSQRLITSSLNSKDMTVEELELELQVSLHLASDDQNSKPTNTEELTNGYHHHHHHHNSHVSVSEQLADVAAKIDSTKTSPTTFLSLDATDTFQQLAPVFFTCLNSEKHLDKFLQLPIFKDDEAKISFLIRIWTNPHYPQLAKSGAIRICCSIILNNDNLSIDYQVIIPHLLIAMQDDATGVRRAATDTFYQLSNRYSTNLTGIFGIDTFYGFGVSDKLRWMASSDLEPFFKVILSRLEEINLGGNVIGTLFGKYLDEASSSHKGKSKPNLALLDFVSAHVFTCPIIEIKISLLHLINNAEKPTKSKSSIFAPLIESWPNDAPNLDNEEGIDYLRELINLITFPSGKDASIKFLFRVLDSNNSIAYNIGCDKIGKIFPSLKTNIQLSIVEKFIDQVIESKFPVKAMETLTNSLALSTNVLDGLLKKCRIEELTVNEGTESPKVSAIGDDEENGGHITRSTTRKRRASSTSSSRLLKDNNGLADMIDKYVKHLSIVLEILQAHQPGNHPTLLPRIFTLVGDLSSLRVESRISISYSYTLQLFADCMLDMVKNVDSFNDVGVDANNVRVDILVNCIRMSNSIQVQNQFLLVLSALAPLVPELVLHSVMPVFTFMGASTLRQDDAFSAHVVDQTISKIIPAMLESQGNDGNNNNTESLVLLLLSFVTAFPHIPRHRRVQLFLSLAKSIGSNHIYLLISLIGGKYYEMKVKSKINEYRAYSNFITAFMSGLPIITRLQVISSILKLISEIPLNEISNEKDQKNKTIKHLYEILWDLSDYNSTQLETFKVAQLDLVYKSILTEDLRRQFLIEYDDATRADDSIKCNEIQQLVTTSLEQVLTTMSDDLVRSKQVLLDEYYLILEGLVSTLPITQFVKFFKNLMLNPNPKVQIRSLSLVSSKFSLEPSGNDDDTSSKAALEILPILISGLQDELTIPETRQLILNGLEVLISKYASTNPTEYSKLFTCLSGSGGLGNASSDVNISAMLCLSSLSSCLGARIVPYLGKIIPLIIFKANEAFKNNDEMLEIADFALLECFIHRIPAFMNSYIIQILTILFESCGKDKPFNSDIQSSRNLIASTISNHLSSKKIFNALSKTWICAINNGFNAQILHVDIFEKTLELADRKIVANNAQSIVTFCLQLLDLRNETNQLDINQDQSLNRIETKCISVLLHVVMKLNDKVFRPLFHQIINWGLESKSVARIYTLFKFLCRMLKQLKSIVTSYYGYLVDPVSDMLSQWCLEKTNECELLRPLILESLCLSFRNDETEFWQLSARFDKIMNPIIQQVNTITIKENPILIKCIIALAQACPSEDQRKAINDCILSNMKSDKSSQVKICSIQILRGVYSKLGDEWVSMLPQLVPIVAELLEDEDEDVEIEVRRKLVPVIEEVLGESLDRYLS